MLDAHEFLRSLTVVLAVAALTTVLFHRLRQPVVLGYLLAGLIVGPHVPIPLVADTEVVRILSELGVILLMFSLGLEFHIGKLIRVAPTAGVTALLQSSLMVLLGFAIGRLFGWSVLTSLFAGAVIAISSTTIIARAFDEQGIRGKLREFVVGILIVEDLIAVMLMAVLTALATGSGLGAGPLLATVGKLAAFLVGLVVAGLVLLPPAARVVARRRSRETTLVASVGFCFAVALLAQSFGYSVALGAFIAGSLVSETGRGRPVEAVIEPVRDMFAAVFFVSVGMLIDPALIARYWPAVAALTLAVVVGKIVAVSIGAFLTGMGMRTSIQSGLSLAQIGEFSFIIAGLGLALRATPEFLYAIAVAVSAITTLLTPWLIRWSPAIAAWVDRKLPRALQTFAALYATWIDELRERKREDSAVRVIRRRVRLLVLDAVLIAAVVVGTAAVAGRVAAFARDRLGLPETLARFVVVTAGVVAAMPFLVGVVRVARRLGADMGNLMLPPKEGRAVDPARAPRRALVLALQLGAVLIVGLPLAALTQPFLPAGLPVAFIGLLLIALGVAFWRSAENLQGHVRAGAQAIVQALASQARRSAGPAAGSTAPVTPSVSPLERVSDLLPGLGDLAAVRLEALSPAVGQTLAQLNLRGLTGATVLAITRAEGGVLVPGATEELRAGDVLALAGTHDAIAAAKARLYGLDGSTSP
jgi:CPA2 family monovalent cation:H+ antiporter-2